MAQKLDCRGLRCPQPVLKIAILAGKISNGETLEVMADCTSFPTDVEKWCKDRGKVLISCVDSGGVYTAVLQF